MEKDETQLISIKDVGKYIGRLGGQATVKKYGKDHFKKLQKLSVEAKKKKKQK